MINEDHYDLFLIRGDDVEYVEAILSYSYFIYIFILIFIKYCNNFIIFKRKKSETISCVCYVHKPFMTLFYSHP